MLRSRGLTIRVAKPEISARKATNEEAELLEVDRNSALLTMDRAAYFDSGRVAEFGQHCYRPDLDCFEATLVTR